jgi:hypothetical protein
LMQRMGKSLKIFLMKKNTRLLYLFLKRTVLDRFFSSGPEGPAVRTLPDKITYLKSNKNFSAQQGQGRL